jgi:hypothetical protein
MNRITLVSVLALVTAFATTGCFGQSAGNEEETGESEQSSRRGVRAGAEEEGNLYGYGQPNQQLELNLHPTDQGQGPHPEPWLQQAGPHPEPWTGKTAEPSGGGGNGKDNKEP